MDNFQEWKGMGVCNIMSGKVLLCVVLFVCSRCCSCSELSPETVHLNTKRMEEWQNQRGTYQTFFHNRQAHTQYYDTHNISLNPKRCGIRGTSAIINDRSHLIMCTVPKVGSSTWRKFMLYLDFPQLSSESGRREYARMYGVSAPDQHNISKNGVKLMAMQSPIRALEYYNDPSYLKVFHCRNPITRLLSAWLSKNAQSSNPLPFAKPFPTFRAFVEDLSSRKVDLLKADGHIRLQRTFCDFDRGAHYDIFLKFENRRHWGSHLLQVVGKQDDPEFQQFVKTSQIPFMGADTVEVILAHYSPFIFQLVRDMYTEDIEAFGYGQDVELLGQIIASAHREQV